MFMRIAIQHQHGSFSSRWIKYCEEKGISYKIVDCYKSDILDQLKDCDALMWHFSHNSPKDFLFAKQLLYSVQASGKKVFPDYHTVWHFDDKVGQKYLLEAINAPLVPSYIFYSRQSAIEWVNKTSFPKVFKLRGGAGSVNVKLVKNKRIAFGLIKKAFRRGYKHSSQLDIKERYRLITIGKGSMLSLFKGMARLFISSDFAKIHGREKGYIYFQDYLPNNDSDTRIIVIGDKAFGIKRLVRKGDFRASGSGSLLFEKHEIDERCLKIAFDLIKKLNAQCIAYDFIFDEKNLPLIVEISYGFSVEAYDACPGYWDRDLNWHEGQFNPQEWMIEDLIRSI
jgi:glutathione synthase/RimK-type ligase-like ATP-grasp enzyme